jgi:hypothetical protein
MKEGVCVVQPFDYLTTCLTNSDCNVGMFCASSKLLQEVYMYQIAVPTLREEPLIKMCMS